MLFRSDLSGEAVQAIKDGKLEFAIDQQQYVQGYLPITLLYLYLLNNNTTGGGLPVATGPGFVTKDNAGVEKKLVYAGYKDKPEFWEMDPAKGLKTEPAPWLDKNGKPIDWYAGKQWDSDIGDAKKALADLEKHYPGAKGYEVAGFFF